MNPIIEIDQMSCSFGRVEAVKNLTLQVTQGSIYAFLGTNGAGKTTTIKTLLNLITPTKGSTRVLGVDSVKLTPGELAQIGYVSENQLLPERLTVRELIEYCQSIYSAWDDGFCQKLLKQLDLPQDRPIKDFSRGMKIKTSLLVSLAYRPRLLILDEPFTGLDPLVRDELISSILELFEQENWTIFISSHDIDEVDRLADYVGIIDNGRLSLSEPLEELKGRFRRVDVILSEPSVPPPILPPSCIMPELSGLSIRWIESQFKGDAEAISQIKTLFPKSTAQALTLLSLREIFVGLTRSNRATQPANV